VPQSEPIIKPVGAPQEIQRSLDHDLPELISEARKDLEEAKETASSSGPVLSGELDQLKHKAFDKCNQAEKIGLELLAQEYVRNTSSVSQSISEQLEEVKKIRNEIETLQ
jgi:hypothetical protein